MLHIITNINLKMVGNYRVERTPLIHNFSAYISCQCFTNFKDDYLAKFSSIIVTDTKCNPISFRSLKFMLR